MLIDEKIKLKRAFIYNYGYTYDEKLHSQEIPWLASEPLPHQEKSMLDFPLH